MDVEHKVHEKLKCGRIVEIHGDKRPSGLHVILVAETDEQEYPNYWAESDSDEKRAIARARELLDPEHAMKGYDQYEGEHPCKVIVAKVIAEFWRDKNDE